MPSFSQIKFSLELDDKAKKMAFSPTSFDRWFEVEYKIRKKHDKFQNLVTSTGRTGHRCDHSTPQKNTAITCQNGRKLYI